MSRWHTTKHICCKFEEWWRIIFEHTLLVTKTMVTNTTFFDQWINFRYTSILCKTRTHARTQSHTNAHTHTHAWRHTRMHAHMHIHTHTHAHSHTCTYTHTHTHTCWRNTFELYSKYIKYKANAFVTTKSEAIDFPRGYSEIRVATHCNTLQHSTYQWGYIEISALDTMYVGRATIKLYRKKLTSPSFLHFFSSGTIDILVSIYQIIRRAVDTMYKGCAKMRLYRKKSISFFPFHHFSLCRMMSIFASTYRHEISGAL